MITLIELDTISKGIYKQKKIPKINPRLTAKNIIEKPEKIVLAMRSCDGTYHKVNSDIKQIFKKKRDIIRRGLLGEITGELNPDESVHGQRFVIFKNGKNQVFLLGDISTTFKQLAHR